jgi:hypothetical protein
MAILACGAPPLVKEGAVGRFECAWSWPVLGLLGAAAPKTIHIALASTKGLLHHELLSPHVLLPIGLDVVQQLLPVVLLSVPLDHVKVGGLLLETLQHRLIVDNDLLVVTEPLLIVQRLLR